MICVVCLFRLLVCLLVRALCAYVLMCFVHTVLFTRFVRSASHCVCFFFYCCLFLLPLAADAGLFDAVCVFVVRFVCVFLCDLCVCVVCLNCFVCVICSVLFVRFLCECAYVV